MKRFMNVFLTILLIFIAPTIYAGGGGGHGGGGHGGGGHYGGGHGGGHYGGHRGGGHFGGLYLGFGFGGYYPRTYGYYSPYYAPYYPPYYPVRVIRSAPVRSTVYIEKPEQAEPAYWYYCTDPKGYYPQVERCASDWLQVVPRSPDD